MHTVYLAGAIEYATNFNWREEYQRDLKEILDIHAINPQDADRVMIPQSVNIFTLKGENPKEYTNIFRRIIPLCLTLIDLSDAVIVRYKGEPIYGTVAEIHHAYMTEKPIYMVSSISSSNIPGWILAEVGVDNVFSSLPCLIGHLADKEYGTKK